MLLVFLAAGAAAEAAALAVGSRGRQVTEVKKRLQELRYIGSGSLTAQYTEKTAEAVRRFQRENGLEETGEVDAATREALFSDAARPLPRPTLKPLATPAPRSGIPDWPETDVEGFLPADGEYFYENDAEGFWAYVGRNLRIEITRVRDGSVPLIWYETDIRTRNGEAFRTALTDPERPGKKYRYPFDIAKENRFVLGFSDDFFANRMAGKETVGVIIRDGRVISAEAYGSSGHRLPNLDMMAQYPDGRLETFECGELDAEALLARGAVNVFSFGPILLRNGEINSKVYTWYRSVEPRHALGMIEPNHYLLLSVEGRTKESRGTMLQRVAEMMRAKGVKEALNLDGGNTMALVFRGRMLNKLATYKHRRFVRTVTSLIGIGETDRQAD